MLSTFKPAVLAASLLFAFAAPQPAAAQTKLLRFPGIHGDKVAFTYAGDLWTIFRERRHGHAAHRSPRHRGLRPVLARREVDRLHPASTRWRKDLKPDTTPADRLRPTIWFPYPDMGQSTADILLAGQSGITPGTSIAKGAFGPFDGQLFCGDQTQCLITRVDLEKIDGHYQGACFPFRKALDCGVNRICWGRSEGLTPANTHGSMFVGQTDRGWGSTGPKRDGLQRVIYTGNLPFEILSMKISPNGFMLEFTREVDVAAATTIANYSMTSYTYNYHPNYGSPETDTKPVKIMGAQVLQGSRIVALTCDPMRSGGMGIVHELHIKGLTCKADSAGPSQELLHPVGYYTVHTDRRAGGRRGAAEVGRLGERMREAARRRPGHCWQCTRRKCISGHPIPGMRVRQSALDPCAAQQFASSAPSGQSSLPSHTRRWKI